MRAILLARRSSMPPGLEQRRSDFPGDVQRARKTSTTAPSASKPAGACGGPPSVGARGPGFAADDHDVEPRGRHSWRFVPRPHRWRRENLVPVITSGVEGTIAGDPEASPCRVRGNLQSLAVLVLTRRARAAPSERLGAPRPHAGEWPVEAPELDT